MMARVYYIVWHVCFQKFPSGQWRRNPHRTVYELNAISPILQRQIFLYWNLVHTDSNCYHCSCYNYITINLCTLFKKLSKNSKVLIVDFWLFDSCGFLFYTIVLKEHAAFMSGLRHVILKQVCQRKDALWPTRKRCDSFRAHYTDWENHKAHFY